jgi:hypothetical protein
MINNIYFNFSLGIFQQKPLRKRNYLPKPFRKGRFSINYLKMSARTRSRSRDRGGRGPSRERDPGPPDGEHQAPRGLFTPAPALNSKERIEVCTSL